MSSLINICGSSLNNEGHIYYLASGITGVLGIIDASECVPTYGSGEILRIFIRSFIKFYLDYEDIRGFILGGFSMFSCNSEVIQVS